MKITANRLLIDKIRKAVQAAEIEIRELKGGYRRLDGGYTSFRTNGPNRPGYASTPPEVIIRNFERFVKVQRIRSQLFRPGLRLANPGSGLGLACFMLALLALGEEGGRPARSFDQIVGYEVDEDLVQAAESIRSQYESHDSRLKNITFRHQSFLPYGVYPCGAVYMYHPFTEGFEAKMGKILEGTNPGTIIISCAFQSPALFPPASFQKLFPQDHELYTYEVVPRTLFVYIRK